MSKISGRVVDYDNDNPIVGVLVSGLSATGTSFASTNTDSGGRYTLDNSGLDDPFSKVSFSKDGYATQSMRVPSANGVDVVLPKASTLSSFTVTIRDNKMKLLLFFIIGAAAVYLFIKYRSQLKF